ncbi:hypothetical protein IW146_001358 [Coemansia sp. RSA 922]|nr:hypothetical protein IW146_001358 [Coemansia sp. RSA 922]
MNKAAIRSAARAYWSTTGTTGLIDDQAARHRLQVCDLAKRLLCEYETTKFGGSPSSGDSIDPLPDSVQLASIRTELINYDNEVFSELGFLTLCLYAGYLTRRCLTTVCIPNHEVYQVWLRMFARAVLGTELADSATKMAHGAFISELWNNKTELLCTLAKSSHGVLSHHNTYAEKD